MQQRGRANPLNHFLRNLSKGQQLALLASFCRGGNSAHNTVATSTRVLGLYRALSKPRGRAAPDAHPLDDIQLEVEGRHYVLKEGHLQEL
jgi:hypothetical protein